MPALGNLWTEPRAVLREVAPRPGGGYRAQVEVAGLVCGVCARRAAAGLAALPGVEGVRFEPERDRFVLTCRTPPDALQVDRAVRATVILPGVRRLLHRLHAAARRRAAPR